MKWLLRCRIPDRYGRKVIGLRSMAGMSGIPVDGQDRLTMEHRGTVLVGNTEIADGVTTKVDGEAADGTMMTMIMIMAIMAAAMPMDTTGNSLPLALQKDQPGRSAGLIRLSPDDESPGNLHRMF